MAAQCSDRQAKRLFDLVLAVVALALTLPVQAAIAVAVAEGIGRPVLFRQVRPGLHGAPFVLVKFRTMLPTDEARGGIDDASRMTTLGRVLRSTSLDELPTLWNVVRGEMSLVGPRPLLMLMQYLDRYTPQQARRHAVLPGLTGLAQVSGRNGLSWERKFALDVEYVDRCSFSLDVRIVLRTIGSVLRREGVSGVGIATMSEFTAESVPQPPAPRRPLIIVGCGGFGREVLCTVQAINAAGGDWVVEGFVDDGPSPADRAAVTALGGRIIGSVDLLASRPDPFHAVVAIGSGAVRQAAVERLAQAPVTYPALIHPDATIGSLASVDIGVVVATGARLRTNITVGAHVHIDQNATVGHDTVLKGLQPAEPPGVRVGFGRRGDRRVDRSLCHGPAGSAGRRLRRGGPVLWSPTRRPRARRWWVFRRAVLSHVTRPPLSIGRVQERSTQVGLRSAVVDLNPPADLPGISLAETSAATTGTR